MDRALNIMLWAGLGCFGLAFLLSGLYPYLITDARDEEASIADVADPVTPHFKTLKEEWPVAFALAFEGSGEALLDRDLVGVPEGDPRRAASQAAWVRVHAEALQRGRDIYVAEACWHCHSQFVRPVANEEIRWGPVRTTREDNNALQRPVLWGTRRVGPDLTHEGGRRSNDWHVAHLQQPTATTPGSIMPAFTWYFREGYQVRRKVNEETAEREGLDVELSYGYAGIYEDTEQAQAVIDKLVEEPPPNMDEEVEGLFIERANGPNEDGLALIAYLQWLGTWDPDRNKEPRR